MKENTDSITVSNRRVVSILTHTQTHTHTCGHTHTHTHIYREASVDTHTHTPFYTEASVDTHTHTLLHSHIPLCCNMRPYNMRNTSHIYGEILPGKVNAITDL